MTNMDNVYNNCMLVQYIMQCFTLHMLPFALYNMHVLMAGYTAVQYTSPKLIVFVFVHAHGNQFLICNYCYKTSI